MVSNKSSDEVLFISALLRDVHTLRSDVFNQRALRLTIQKIATRSAREGIGFLTKTMPHLGKALDRALTGEHIMDSVEHGFKPMPGSKLPMLMGELFRLVFNHDGKVLPSPCVRSITELRQILYLFYKYEIPYSAKQEQKVILQFLQTEDDLKDSNETFSAMADHLENHSEGFNLPHIDDLWWPPNVDCESIRIGCRSVNPREGVSDRQTFCLALRARALLCSVLSSFDPTDIHPKHGPGAVSTREKLWGKYFWTNINDRIAERYPIDAYFYASLGHVCDSQAEITQLGSKERSARVILVPKDSRGPRLISCEPLENQWVQQGLGAALVRHVERHSFTKRSVRFTDQRPNQQAALLGSLDGGYATLDLKEASDRVSVGLVRLLWPSKVLPYLLACRSLATTLPDGRVIALRKYAPMGSALCFPVLALTIWAILHAGIDDAHTRESMLVYGDDVIVPTAQAMNAIELLERFGLLVNRSKSCVSGFFRESCGVDAYMNADVTPIRIRTVWPSSPSPDSYISWIAKANQFYDKKYMNVYEMICQKLFQLYGHIPDKSMGLLVPSLRSVPNDRKPQQTRINKALQKREYKVRDVVTKPIRKTLDGWRMLLRFFTEATNDTPFSERLILTRPRSHERLHGSDLSQSWECHEPFMVSSYTRRGTNQFVHRWR
jgi:hypothetical protein